MMSVLGDMGILFQYAQGEPLIQDSGARFLDLVPRPF